MQTISFQIPAAAPVADTFQARGRMMFQDDSFHAAAATGVISQFQGCKWIYKPPKKSRITHVGLKKKKKRKTTLKAYAYFFFLL